MRFTHVGPIPSDIHPQFAAPNWVVGISSDESEMQVRGPEGRKVLHSYRVPGGEIVGDVFLDLPYLVVITKSPNNAANDSAVVIDTESGRSAASDEARRHRRVVLGPLEPGTSLTARNEALITAWRK